MNLLNSILFWLVLIGGVGTISYYLMKAYFKHKKDYFAFTQLYNQDKGILQERLQAFERLMLFLDRINIPQLLLRMASDETHPEGLTNALMIAIQKEYEYNAPQQLYFSDEMWQIINLAKDDALAFIQETASDPNVTTAAQLQALLLKNWGDRAQTPIEMAQKALRKEAGLYLN